MNGWVGARLGDKWVGRRMDGWVDEGEDGWLHRDRSVGGWVDTKADGRAGNKTLVCQDLSSSLSQPSAPPRPFSQTLLGDQLTVTSEGGQAADPRGLQGSGSLTAHLTESRSPLPCHIPRSDPTQCPGEEKQDSATSCNHEEQTKQNTPSPLVPKIASLATQTRWLAGSPSFEPD